MSVLTKTCSTCFVEKSFDSFWKNSRNKDGKDNRCTACTKIHLSTKKEASKESQRKWREKNPDYMRTYGQCDKSREYHRTYYQEHKTEYIKRKQQWRKDNPEQETKARQKYVEENRDQINEYHREWKRKKRDTDIQYKLSSNTSRRIRYELNTLLKGKKTKRTVELIGCSIEFLKRHIETKFEDDMSWDNYGKVWEIDHIIPCSSWNLADEFENICCWNYRNLQPLSKYKNRSKCATFNEIDKERYITEIKSLQNISVT